jgi:hypothetical protein
MVQQVTNTNQADYPSRLSNQQEDLLGNSSVSATVPPVTDETRGQMERLVEYLLLEEMLITIPQSTVQV